MSNYRGMVATGQTNPSAPKEIYFISIRLIGSSMLQLHHEDSINFNWLSFHTEKLTSPQISF